MGFHSHLKRKFGAWFYDQPMQLKLALSVIPVVGSAIVAKIMSELQEILGLDEWQIATLFVLLVLILALVTLLWRRRSIDTITLPDNIEVRRVFAPNDLEEIGHGLHSEIYGGVAPASDEINRMYVKNPRMGVGLYDKKKRAYVAFATGWPLKTAAAEELLAGTRTENELVADDILPEAENLSATYVLVPAFGATDREGRWQRSCLGLMLREEMRKAFKQNFFKGNRRRPIKLIATGFSAGGKEICRSLGLEPVRHVAFEGSKKEVPVFLGEIRRDQLS